MIREIRDGAIAALAFILSVSIPYFVWSKTSSDRSIASDTHAIASDTSIIANELGMIHVRCLLRSP